MSPRQRILTALAALMAFAAIGVAPAATAGAKLASVDPSKSPTAPHRSGKRELRERTLTVPAIRAGPIPELHVAAEAATALAFPAPLRKDGVLLSDRHDAFMPPRIVDRVLVLLAKKDLAPDDLAALTVTLADGTLLSFNLVTSPKDVDLQVDVEMAHGSRPLLSSSGEKAPTTEELEAKLDDCQASASTAGTARITRLILAEDPGSSASTPIDRHPVHRLDKQSALLVEAKQVYRLFGTTYLVLTVQNRHPDKNWLFERPTVQVTGGGAVADLAVASFAADPPSLVPDQIGRIVVAFVPPAGALDQHLTVSLFEKGGTRHVVLSDLSL